MLFKKSKKDNATQVEEHIDTVNPPIESSSELVESNKKKKQKKPKSKFRKIIEWICTGILVALIGGCAFILIYSKVNSGKDPKNPNAPIAIGNTYLPVIVLTNSMEPKYPVGSAIFINKKDPADIYQQYLEWENAKTDPSIPEDERANVVESLAVDLTFNDNYTANTPDSIISPLELRDRFNKTQRTTRMYGGMGTMTHRIFYAEIDEKAKEGQPKYYFFVSGINPEGEKSAQYQYQVFTEDYLYGQVSGCSVFIGGLFRFAQSPVGLVVLLLIPCLYMIISSVIDLFRSQDEIEEKKELENQKEIALQSSDDPLKGLTEKDRERLKKDLLNKMMEEKQNSKKEDDK